MFARFATLLVAFSLTAGLAGPAAGQGFLVPPDDPSLGNSTFNLETQRVLIAVESGVASFQVDQEFRNNTGRQLEATFYFPLPENAALADFSMWINGKKTRGELLEREQAVQVYEEIVRRLVDPGILEYVGQDLIRARIFPIPAHGTQKIQVCFESLVDVEGSLAEVRYPLKAPAAMTGTTGDLTVKAEIHSDIPVRSVYSPTHPVDVVHSGDAVIAGFEQGAATFDKDFKLYYTLSEEPVGVSVACYKTSGEDGYFLLMAAPGEDRTAAAMPKDITFVVDTSGSMAGDKIRGAREALKFSLNSLNAHDRFNVVRFSTGVEPFAGSLQSASPDNLARAQSFVERFEALGGTNISDALDTALQHTPQSGRPYYIVFMTDGLPTVGVTSADSILAQANRRVAAMDGAVRFFTLGVGHDVNTTLLDSLAADNRGMAEYLAADEDLEIVVSNFYRKISRPVLADLQLDLGGAAAYDVFPRELPDLFSGSQLLVMGRYKGAGAQKVRLSGTAAGDSQVFATNIAFDSARNDHEFIPRLWAQRKVGFLLDEMRRNGEQRELVDEVITLSKRFGIMTPYTSFLVVEDTAVASNRVTTSTDAPAITAPTPDSFVRGGATRSRDERDRSREFAPVPEATEDSLADGGGWDRYGSDDGDFSAAEPSAAPLRRGRGAGAAYKKAEESQRSMSGYGLSSGAEAVAASEAIGELKDAERSDSASLSRVVGDKVFHLRGSGWVDERYEGSMQTLSVRYLSDVYFALLRFDPTLRRYAALGDTVTIVVRGNKAIVISPSGGEPTEAEMHSFLR
ncbi:MAG: VIT domain-containing protein [Myxococcota bacterium]|nr:VIT domain-containing protein [Myxococcota bacterium]